MQKCRTGTGLPNRRTYDPVSGKRSPPECVVLMCGWGGGLYGHKMTPRCIQVGTQDEGLSNEDDFFFLVFLGPHPRHMGVPRLGVESEL